MLLYTVTCSKGAQDLIYWSYRVSPNTCPLTDRKMDNCHWFSSGWHDGLLKSTHQCIPAVKKLCNFPLVLYEAFQGCCFLPASSSDLELLDFVDVSSHKAMPSNRQRHILYLPGRAFMSVLWSEEGNLYMHVYITALMFTSVIVKKYVVKRF